ncbi:MAG: hypothetical protein AB8F74_19555 [Saprospiraceae bacterium]
MSFFSNLFKRRSTTMKEMAAELAMDYYESDEQELIHGLAGFKLFQRGRRRRVNNLLSLIDSGQGFEICIFDYAYTIGGGQSNSRKKQTVFMVRSSGLNLPIFHLKPKHMLHKLGEYIGWTKDIIFESHPVFSEAYLLQGNQEIDIRHVFHTDLLDFFSREASWHLEGYGNEFLLFRDSGRMDKEEMRNLFDKGEYVYSLLR